MASIRQSAAAWFLSLARILQRLRLQKSYPGRLCETVRAKPATHDERAADRPVM